MSNFEDELKKSKILHKAFMSSFFDVLDGLITRSHGAENKGFSMAPESMTDVALIITAAANPKNFIPFMRNNYSSQVDEEEYEELLPPEGE